PETSSMGVAIRVTLFNPARPRAIEVSACVTGSIGSRRASLTWTDAAHRAFERLVKYYTGSGMARVSASGTMRKSAGRRPAGSPSTWISTGDESIVTQWSEVALQNWT